MNVTNHEVFTEGLPGYRAIDANIHVGHIPLAHCLELQTTVAGADELGPAVQLDRAWLTLETSLSIVRGLNDQTGKLFSPQEVEQAKQQSQGEFRGLVRNEQLPASIRAAAGLAMASVGMHYEIDRTPPPKAGSKHHLSYLRGLQQAAKVLLAKENRTPEDDELLYSMTSIAVLTESRAEGMWFLPTPPRQPWGINGVNQRHSKVAHIAITNEASEGIMAIPPDVLGNDRWKSGVPHATLADYVKVQAGFSQVPIRNRSPQPIDIVFDVLLIHLGKIMDSYEWSQPSAALPEVETVTEADTTKSKRSEVDMYLMTVGDVRDLNTTSLRLQMLNVEEAQSRGELGTTQQHALGWMQLEYARTIVIEAQEKRRQAHTLRVKAERISKFDAKQLWANATEVDQAADQLIIAARERFDMAETTFINAAEAGRETDPAESLATQLSSKATPVYKELFTASDPEALTKAVSNYLCGLVSLAKPLRAQHRASRDNPDQLDVLEETALKAALCLLVSNASEESTRSLALPTTFRSLGKRGSMDVTVFPLDYTQGTYDIDDPVNVQISEGNRVVQERRYVQVGWDLLSKKDNKGALLTSLEAADGVPGQTHLRRQPRRSVAIDKIALRITDAIADAAE